MRNKYNAKRQLYKGIRFDSKKELNRYLILEQMQMKNYISELEIHPVYPLLVNGIKIGRYTADFKYKNKDGEEIIEDVKSKITRTRDYILRKKDISYIYSTYNNNGDIMSWSALDWASKQKTGNGTNKLVLLCLANYADDKKYLFPKL